MPGGNFRNTLAGRASSHQTAPVNTAFQGAASPYPVLGMQAHKQRLGPAPTQAQIDEARQMLEMQQTGTPMGNFFSQLPTMGTPTPVGPPGHMIGGYRPPAHQWAGGGPMQGPIGNFLWQQMGY